MSTSVAVRRLVHDGLFWHHQPSFVRSLLYTGVVLLAAFLSVRSAFTIDGTAMLEGHTTISLEMALNRAYCGGPTSLSHTIRVPHDIVARPELRYVPLRDIILARTGSFDDYCRAVDWPFVNSENALMLMEAELLQFMPAASLRDLGQAMHVLRIVFLASFVLLLIDLGASLALGFATMLCGLMILQAMPDRVYSNYPFLFTLVLATAALYGFGRKYRWTRGLVPLVLFGLGAGVWSAFVVNMRTSYLPVMVLTFVVVLIDELRPRAAEALRGRAVRAAALAACFAIGYVAIQQGVVNRALPADGRFDAAHPFAHPLVLALAVPDNDFSRAMGIRWADEVGPQKVATVDPDAPYLGPRYNAALLQYYTGLWRTHPREMLSVYYLKFSLAGADMIRVLRGSPGVAGAAVRTLLTPLAWLPNGVWLLALYVALAIASLAFYYRHESIPAFVLALLTMTACLLLAESGVIFSIFVKQYHNYSAFFAMFVSLLGVQALANGAWRAITGPLPAAGSRP